MFVQSFPHTLFFSLRLSFYQSPVRGGRNVVLTPSSRSENWRESFSSTSTSTRTDACSCLACCVWQIGVSMPQYMNKSYKMHCKTILPGRTGPCFWFTDPRTKELLKTTTTTTTSCCLKQLQRNNLAPVGVRWCAVFWQLLLHTPSVLHQCFN